MARGGGIEIPITVDASDLPRARKQIEAFFKKVSKDAGKYSVIDVFSGGKRVGVGGVAGIKGMEKYWAHFAKGAKEIKKVEMALKHMSARVKNAEKATKHYAKALEMVTTGRQISASLTDQLIHFYKKAPQYMAGLVAEWNKYVVLLRDAKLTDKKRAEYEERKARAMKFILEDLGIEISGKERLKRLEKGLEGQLARTKKQYRDTLTYQQRALKVAEVKARWLRDARKVISDEKREYARLLFLHKQGLITEQQKIQLVKLSNELTARGVRLKMRETKEWRKIAKEARKITERRGLFPGGSL
ncbi:MAG: hypothetical protein GWN64_07415, partial [Candidatus Thorarchaeota archaeon]|nr:hypothetical protein [Candidatus Thorarchaeota archaeon]